MAVNAVCYKNSNLYLSKIFFAYLRLPAKIVSYFKTDGTIVVKKY